jgi:glycosyltransferase involved in cell wall biosynthesis
MSYVVAFNRDRDSYQVPLALHERGLLANLITDYYRPDADWMSRLPGLSRLAHRHVPALPARKVVSKPLVAASQIFAPRLGVHAERVFRWVNGALSRAALRTARRANADLFLYSEYAYEAFAAPAAAAMVKGLFFFHPHTALVHDILSRDFAAFPECAWSIGDDFDMRQPAARKERLNAEWELADFVVCASAFTARSLIFAGCDLAKITIVPYGIDMSAVPAAATDKPSGPCRFLFVGQGIQRKGLHHLLRAWRALGLVDAQLTVVASVMDPGIAALAGENVRLLGRQTRAELLRLYGESHVFVMPSLVEGFGLVYLEALAAGCYSIGTTNTGLPDLQPTDAEAAVLPPGDIEGLKFALENAYDRHRQGALDSQGIREFAAAKTWATFRRGVADVATANLAAAGRTANT